MADRVGQQLGNYQLLRLLGQGAFATVYLGEHQYLERAAAIKVLHVQMDSAAQRSFQREARTIAQLHHPHIIGVHDFGVEDQIPYLVMEYNPGGTLRSRHPKGAQLSFEQIVCYVKQIAAALDYAHQQHVIHRDVKPENLLLNGGDDILLSDFGLAVVQRTLDSLSTQNPAGTPVYMAPEQIQRKPCAASDQYALGVLVYEWLCGEPPFRGSLFEVFSHHLHEPPPSLCERLPQLPPTVEDAVFRALAKDPYHRFHSVQDFAAVLEEVCCATQPLSSHRFTPNATRAKPATVPFPVSPSPQMSLDRPVFPGSLPPIWNVPYPQNPLFTGREELLTQLAITLHAGQPTALSQPQAISGLGGIGKTQLALEYAYRYRQDYQVVLWAQADTRENLTSSYLTIATLLNLPEKSEQESARVITAVKNWFQRNANWLLILDNADELTLAREFLPPSFGGHVLLTTRAQATGRFARRLEIDILPTGQGTLFLLRRAGLLAPDAPLEQAVERERDVAHAICKELGGLPLALDQAGAYIEETGCSLAEYQSLYQRRRADLQAERRGQLVDDHPLPVATTWSLSFRQVEQNNPAAADLLRLCAFLAPDAIPEEIVTQGAEHLGPQLAPVGADSYLLNQSIEALRAYSLLRREASSDAEPLLSVHRLVQAVLKDQMDERTQQQWAERAVSAVDAARPAVEHGSWPQWERLLAHALACSELIEHQRVHAAEATELLQRTGWYLTERARYQEAELLLKQALSITEQEHGLEHLDTARDSVTLAYLYLVQGKYEQAEPLLQRALAIREQQLGPTHPDTAQSLNNLAEPQQEAQIQALLWRDIGHVWSMIGEYERAYDCNRRGRAVMQEAGITTGVAWACLQTQYGSLLRFDGNYQEARRYVEEALEVLERVVQPGTPSQQERYRALANREAGQISPASPITQHQASKELQTRTERTLAGDPIDIGYAHEQLGIIATWHYRGKRRLIK